MHEVQIVALFAQLEHGELHSILKNKYYTIEVLSKRSSIVPRIAMAGLVLGNKGTLYACTP